MQIVGALNWTSTPNATGPVAQQAVNFTTDPTWRINTARGTYVGNPVFPAAVMVDNSAGSKAVSVTINGIPNFISANSRTHVPLQSDGVQFIDVAGTVGSACNCVFYADEKDVPPDAPNYAAIVQQAVNLAVPAGTVLMYCGIGAIPAGFLLCDGAAVNRVVFATLFASIGVAYGPGDGVSTFNLPDGRDRVFIGSSPGGISATRPSVRNIGDNGGEETHTLVTGEIATHTHVVTDPGHQHFQGLDSTGATGAQNSSPYAGAFAGYSLGTTLTENKATGVTIANAGGGGSHNNMQPFVTGQWMISTGG